MQQALQQVRCVPQLQPASRDNCCAFGHLQSQMHFTGADVHANIVRLWQMEDARLMAMEFDKKKKLHSLMEQVIHLVPAQCGS